MANMVPPAREAIVESYHVKSWDGEVGHVDDLLLDDDVSLFLVVEVKGWLFGKKVLAGPSLISRVDGAAAQTSLIAIRVYNYAGVRKSILEKAKFELQRVFRVTVTAKFNPGDCFACVRASPP